MKGKIVEMLQTEDRLHVLPAALFSEVQNGCVMYSIHSKKSSSTEIINSDYFN